MEFSVVTLKQMVGPATNPATTVYALLAVNDPETDDYGYLNVKRSSGRDQVEAVIDRAKTSYAEGKITFERSENWRKVSLVGLGLKAPVKSLSEVISQMPPSPAVTAAPDYPSLF